MINKYFKELRRHYQYETKTQNHKKKQKAEV